jgi:hypothetical protein
MRTAAAVAALVASSAGVALADGPTITATVKPNTPKAHSALKVSARGPFSASGLPRSVEIDVQKGFRSSAKSVPALCNPSKLPCPAESKVGSGQVEVTIMPFIGRRTFPFTMYLGKPRQPDDVASIVLRATVEGQQQHVVGRLFHAPSGSLEILFDHLPTYSPPPGVTVTPNHLTLRAHATHKSGRKTYSLITNPPKCATGHWTGNVTITFRSGPVTQPLSLACSK